MANKPQQSRFDANPLSRSEQCYIFGCVDQFGLSPRPGTVCICCGEQRA